MPYFGQDVSRNAMTLVSCCAMLTVLYQQMLSQTLFVSSCVCTRYMANASLSHA